MLGEAAPPPPAPPARRLQLAITTLVLLLVLAVFMLSEDSLMTSRLFTAIKRRERWVFYFW
jgi:hypothetical protein